MPEPAPILLANREDRVGRRYVLAFPGQAPAKVVFVGLCPRTGNVVARCAETNDWLAVPHLAWTNAVVGEVCGE